MHRRSIYAEGVVMSCNERLKAEGKPHPRQCRKCQFGPCTERPQAPDVSSTLKYIAGLLQKLPYRDMSSFAQKIEKHRDNGRTAMVEALLAASDEILAGPQQ
jgi:hypothetical protein